jgi:hypothetical protein
MNRTPIWCLSCTLSWLIVAAAAATAAQPDPGAAVSLDQLMAELRGVQHVQARYIERRTIAALRAPIETSGTLLYDAPDRLVKTSEPVANRAADRLAINGNRLTIDRGDGKAPVVLMLNEHPEVGVLVESIRATLAGDAVALRRNFDISLAGTIGGWQVVLQPHDPAQRAMLQWVRITGAAERISAIDTQTTDGNHAEMAIVDQKP